MDELLEIIYSEDFQEQEGVVHLTGVRIEGDILALSINLFAAEAIAEEDQGWVVECGAVLDHMLSLGNCQDFTLHDDHPLLWQYVHPECSLSFYGDSSNPEAIVGELYNRHVELAGHLIPFKTFLNGNPLEIVRGRYGMFATGPAPLMEGYADVFARAGIKAGVSEPRHVSLTTDPFTQSSAIEVLLLGERSYVVAQKFNANRSEDRWDS